jgi:lactoylglutathione lyase
VPATVHELRVAVTAPDYDEALVFYRDVLGLRERAAFASEDGRVTILDAGRATLELLDPTHAAFVDEVEVGRRVAGHVRIALEVDDSSALTAELAHRGARARGRDRRRAADAHALGLAEREARGACRAPAHALHRALPVPGGSLGIGLSGSVCAADRPLRRGSLAPVAGVARDPGPARDLLRLLLVEVEVAERPVVALLLGQLVPLVVRHRCRTSSAVQSG